MKITLEQVLEKSNPKLIAGPDTGKKVLERNLEKMKKMKKSQIEYLFRNGKLDKSKPKKEVQADYKIITSSRRYVRISLKMIIEEAKMKNDKIKTPIGGLGKLAAQLISKKNILEKFKNAELEWND